MAQFSFRSGNPIIGFVIGALILVGAFYFLKGLFWVLTWLSPILLIVTLIMNHHIVVDYLKMLWKQLLETPFFGVICIVMSFFAAPVIIFYLFGKMMLLRKAKEMQQRFEYQQESFKRQFEQSRPTQDADGFTPYEEISDKRIG
jgi:hypothetical protein